MFELSIEKIIRDIISRRDPSGYYILLVYNTIDAKSILAQYTSIIIEEYGGILVVKCKSRRIVEELVRKLSNRSALLTH